MMIEMLSPTSPNKVSQPYWYHKTPVACKVSWCDSNPLLPKTHGLCPKHYQRVRRGYPLLDHDEQLILQYFYDKFGMGIFPIEGFAEAQELLMPYLKTYVVTFGTSDNTLPVMVE